MSDLVNEEGDVSRDRDEVEGSEEEVDLLKFGLNEAFFILICLILSDVEIYSLVFC